MEKPVTVIVRRRVRASMTERFEAWQREAIATHAKFEGHLGTEVIRPDDPSQQDYVIVFRFATNAGLAAWEKSPERAKLLERVEPMTEQLRVEKVTGLEHWFSLPGRATPPRWKMAVVTVLAIYPLVLFFVPFMAKLLGELPRWGATLITVCSMVIGMTWLVMPALTRAFARWLYPLS